MTSKWYYVENKDRVGPIEEEELVNLVKNGSLFEESYVWKKGLENWTKIKEVSELEYVFVVESPGFIESMSKDGIDWDNTSLDESIFSIKVGLDRGGNEAEYGPFSLNMLKRLYNENRINGKTLVFSPGMSNWMFLADLEIFEKVFEEIPPEIDDSERRRNIRKPFIARILFHDNSLVYEGVCRDISTGGLQVLVADFPAEVGTIVSMNVHPDNSDYSFVAEGTVVRKLDGNQGFSLRFSNLGDETKTAINNYIES